MKDPANTTSVAPSDVQLEAITSQYSEGRLNRREFMSRLILMTGSMAAAHLLIEKTGLASVISQKETADAGNGTIQIRGEDVSFSNGPLNLSGYLATPQGEGLFPAVVVIHENRGLNEHTRDVARRFAIEGFVALAPDGLSRRGGTASMKTPDDARAAIGTLALEETLSDLEAALTRLNTLPQVRKGHLGSVGFCWGGARSFALATTSDQLKAAVVFYGSAPENLTKVKVPVLGLYGETDTRITSEVPTIAAKMKEAGKSFDFKVYPGAGHAFFNDTGERYNPTAAADAWTKTIEFLREQLK